MKKFFILCMLLTSMMSMGVHAQGYSVLITGDFEAKCLMPNEGPFYIEEFPGTLVACEGCTVVYTAHSNTNGHNIVNWSWYVEGGTVNSTNNDQISITWGSAGQGLLMVTITTDAGYTHTHSQLVSIVEKPVVGAMTSPESDANHIIEVCMGMDVVFTDTSSAPNSNIMGYYWEGCNTTSRSRTFTLESVTSGCTVKHRVYNSCGCYDEEEFQIIVIPGDPLVISCYGTACKGSTVSYQATSPNCSDYHWVIEGGTLADGQGSPDFTVVWNSPQDGYGVISLDGNVCGNGACRAGLKVRIPLIDDSIEITGRASVCEGDTVVYSVPLYGSTRYTWKISNNNNVYEIPYNNANKIMYAFPTPGSYTIRVEYQCDFLKCGPFYSKTFVVDVKPKLEIVGEDEVCLTNDARYTTADGAACLWTVYELPSNNIVYNSAQSETEFAILNNITTAGDYKITADNSNYCNIASFVVSVKDPPPAPTILNMDPSNPMVACPHSGIHLLGQTYNPEYNLIWQTVCEPNSSASGDDVTLFYDDEVCDVEVYTYDRRLRCRSVNAYNHHVEPFELEPVSLPSDVQVVCPGALITWTGNDVPYQPEVIYKWELEDQKQYCATIEGDKHSNTISLRINDFPQPFNTQTFDLYLYRTYCSGITDITTVHFNITDNPNATIGITLPNGICQGTQASLQGTGCSGDYQWNIAGDNHTYTGNPFSHTFKRSGYYDITMSCNPYDYCNNREYYTSVTTSVYVTPKPPVVDIFYDGTYVYTVPPMSTNDYLFEWDHTTTNSSIVPGDPNLSSYTCTVTSLTAPYCSVTVGTSASSSSTPCNPLTVQQVGAFDYCNGIIRFQVLNPPSSISWIVRGNTTGTPTYEGTNNEIINIPIDSVGDYSVTAIAGDQPCYRGHAQFTVDFLPRFDVEKHCTYVTIINKSMYTDTNKFMTLSVNNTTMGTYRVNKDTINYYTGNGGTFDFKLTGYDMQTFSIPCNIGSETITNSAGSSVTITTANPYNQSTTCTNTPIELTAAIVPPHTVVSTHWEFGDTYNTFLDTVGRSVYHTFEQRGSSYKVKVSVIDENGCVSKDSIDITSKANPLEAAGMDFLSSHPVCPGFSIDIQYLANNAPPLMPAYYNWIEFGVTDQSAIRTVYNEGTYHVDAFNHDYCTGKASQSVSYFGKPSAIIIPKKYSYCTGETIVLYGEPDDIHSYQYSWTVYNTTTGMTSNYSTGTVKFPAGNDGCNYIIDLTVTDAHGCTNKAPTLTLPVAGPFPAPGISFDDPYCIHKSPVHLVSNIDKTHWSNGDFGYDAHYGYPGVAMAWYYDYTTGCCSDTAVLKIPEAPDFDALLTGCYSVCEDSASAKLPVYGLLPYWQEYGWDWHYLDYIFAHEDFGNGHNPLILPLNGFGLYQLDVNYHKDCVDRSRQLILTEAERCKCDSLEITSEVFVGYDKECHLIYNISVKVRNLSNIKRCFSQLLPQYNTLAGNISITSSTFTPGNLPPHDSITFYLTLSVSQLMPTTVVFKLIDDDCINCEAYFSIDLMPNVACTTDSLTNVITPRLSLSGGGIYYYDFTKVLYGVSEVLAVWSDPASVVNYSYNTATHTLSGLCAFELGDEDSREVCLYILVCTENGLCVHRYCQKVYSYESRQNKRGGGTPQETADAPQLKPNPATGMVGVVSNGEVTEVLVMDMKGRQMATFSNTTSFNVANLATGTYIVRIKSRHGANAAERITYLKLVKQ